MNRYHFPRGKLIYYAAGKIYAKKKKDPSTVVAHKVSPASLLSVICVSLFVWVGVWSAELRFIVGESC